MTESKTIAVYPYDLGFEAAKSKVPLHTNPFKSPNTQKTDDVKSEAWLRGYDDFLRKSR